MGAEAARWIDIDDERYEDERAVEEAGVIFHVFVSPYDMPEAVMGDYDSERERFIIRFRYIEDESLEEEVRDQYVTFYVGKHSHRLYRIEADVHGLGASSVVLRVTRAIEQLKGRLGEGATPTENFRVATAVLKDNEEELTRPLPAAP